MWAYVYKQYGPPEVLKLCEVETPSVGDDDVLVRVLATSVNPGDWVFLTGKPYLVRLVSGLTRPKYQNPGHDVAGRVEAVGANVTQFRVGNEVYGGRVAGGAFAEFICMSEAHLAIRPGNLSFAQAAAVPVAGVSALQLLRAGGACSKDIAC